jgi:hypothetical protein
MTRLVASDTPLDLARHQVREAPHALDGSPFGVQGDEVQRLHGRHAERGGAVVGHVGKAQHLLRHIGRSAGNQHALEIVQRSMDAGAGDQRPRHLLDDRDLLDLAALDVRFQAVVDVLQVQRRHAGHRRRNRQIAAADRRANAAAHRPRIVEPHDPHRGSSTVAWTVQS